MTLGLANTMSGHTEEELAMPTTTLKVTGMKSDDCQRLVMNAIQDLPCIGHVEVSLASGEAVIEHTAMVSESDIREIIEEAGYPTA